VDLSLREEPYAFRGWTLDELDVPTRTQPDVGEDDRHVDVLRQLEPIDCDPPALEIADRPYGPGSEQLEAAGVDAREDRYRVAGLDPDDRRRRKVEGDVEDTGGHRVFEGLRLRRVCDIDRDVLDRREALGLQQVADQELRGLAHRRRLGKPDPG